MVRRRLVGGGDTLRMLWSMRIVRKCGMNWRNTSLSVNKWSKICEPYSWHSFTINQSFSWHAVWHWRRSVIHWRQSVVGTRRQYLSWDLVYSMKRKVRYVLSEVLAVNRFTSFHSSLCVFNDGIFSDLERKMAAIAVLEGSLSSLSLHEEKVICHW